MTSEKPTNSQTINRCFDLTCLLGVRYASTYPDDGEWLHAVRDDSSLPFLWSVVNLRLRGGRNNCNLSCCRGLHRD